VIMEVGLKMYGFEASSGGENLITNKRPAVFYNEPTTKESPILKNRLCDVVVSFQRSRISWICQRNQDLQRCVALSRQRRGRKMVVPFQRLKTSWRRQSIVINRRPSLSL